MAKRWCVPPTAGCVGLASSPGDTQSICLQAVVRTDLRYCKLIVAANAGARSTQSAGRSRSRSFAQRTSCEWRIRCGYDVFACFARIGHRPSRRSSKKGRFEEPGIETSMGVVDSRPCWRQYIVEPTDSHVHAQNAWRLFTLLLWFAEGGVFQEQPTHLEAGRLDNIYEAVKMALSPTRVWACRRAPSWPRARVPNATAAIRANAYQARPRH